jgi:electron transfer flavoprotein beta subunit
LSSFLWNFYETTHPLAPLSFKKREGAGGVARKRMNIIVPLKQVPETSNVKMDEATGTMIREGVESIINPLDLYAIETAIQLKEQSQGRVTAISMGPPNCKKALKEAIAMGCDDALQISHPKFAGADTWATSYVLAETIRQKAPHFDLILCGERATDGDTGQVGPGIASFLNLPFATYISKIYDLNAGQGFRVHRLVEGGYEILALPFPALLTVVKEISFPRLPTLRGKQRAKNIAIPIVQPDDLQIPEDRIGLRGSPTQVVKIFRPKVSRQGVKYVIKEADDVEHVVNQLVTFLQERRCV